MPDTTTLLIRQYQYIKPDIHHSYNSTKIVRIIILGPAFVVSSSFLVPGEVTWSLVLCCVVLISNNIPAQPSPADPPRYQHTFPVPQSSLLSSVPAAVTPSSLTRLFVYQAEVSLLTASPGGVEEITFYITPPPPP